ncbi:MAG TPA: universal stress protein [Gaiellaceae bacterium]|nr:universal stress protein [Gaiellaceae bacterium]
MFKRVMWATDGLAAADSALPYAKALVPADGALLVVHCKELFVGRGGGYPLRADEPALLAKIRDQVAKVRREGVNAELKLASGPSAARSIAHAAADLDADVIVVGTRGHGAISGLLTGNTTRRLFHIAPCPVFAVGPEAKPGAPVIREPAVKKAA